MILVLNSKFSNTFSLIGAGLLLLVSEVAMVPDLFVVVVSEVLLHTMVSDRFVIGCEFSSTFVATE